MNTDGDRHANTDAARECLDETMQAMTGGSGQGPVRPVAFPPAHGEVCRETIETGHQDLRYRLSVMPGAGSERQPDDSWAWPVGEPFVDLHLLPVYAFTELMFARVSRFMVAYDPARPVLEQFAGLVAVMRAECAAVWLGPAVVVLGREAGLSAE